MMATIADTPWMTTQETADYCRRHEKTVLRALRRGQLAGSQIAARSTWRIHRDDADRWMRGLPPATRS